MSVKIWANKDKHNDIQKFVDEEHNNLTVELEDLTEWLSEPVVEKKTENLERFRKPDMRPKPEQKKENVLDNNGWRK